MRAENPWAPGGGGQRGPGGVPTVLTTAVILEVHNGSPCDRVDWWASLYDMVPQFMGEPSRQFGEPNEIKSRDVRLAIVR